MTYDNPDEQILDDEVYRRITMSWREEEAKNTVAAGKQLEMSNLTSHQH